MRVFLSKEIEKLAKKNKKIIFITGDLGFNAFENLKYNLKERFLNAGVAETNMVSFAAGLAYTGFRPFVYSIAPFITLKTIEQIRNDVCFPKLPIIFVGNGGGFGYGIMGPTHHNIEDLSVLSSLINLKIYMPAYNLDIKDIIKIILKKNEPSYIRLGLAPQTNTNYPYAPIRNILKGEKLVIITWGPIIHEILKALDNFKNDFSLWLISEYPFDKYYLASLLNEIKKIKRVLIIEEHIENGGVAEKIAKLIIKQNYKINYFENIAVKGYLSKKYGSQKYHWIENKLDHKNIKKILERFIKNYESIR